VSRRRLCRPEQLETGKLTGATVHVLHVARGHIVPEDITGGSPRAGELDVDLLVLGHQHHRGSRTAERVIHRHPPYSILLARPPH